MPNGFRNLSEKLDSGIQFYPDIIHDHKGRQSQKCYTFALNWHS